MKPYFNIHSHTHYSNTKILDSINTPQSLIENALKLGLSGIAITDHGLTSGWVQFEQEYSKIKEANPDFNIGFGCEIYMSDARERGQKYYHYLLCAKNIEGVKLIREISSIGWINSYWDYMTRTPVLKEELKTVVEKAPGSLIATSACLGGSIPKLVSKLIEAENVGADTLSIKYEIQDEILFSKELFGDDFYIEVAPSADVEQIAYNKRVRPIAEALGVKMIFATDAHYGRPEDRPVHKLYLNSKAGEREVDDFYKYTYVMSFDECEELLLLSYDKEFIEQMRLNTLEIQGKVDSFSLRRTEVVRQVDVVEPEYCGLDISNLPVSNQWLNSSSLQNRFYVKTCINYVVNNFGGSEEYLQRIEHEIDVLDHISKELKTEMSAYLNFLGHYIKMFWEEGSVVGPGRGSAVGFLGAAAMGITQIDPIEYELPAFRFLNKDAVGLPKMLGRIKMENLIRGV